MEDRAVILDLFRGLAGNGTTKDLLRSIYEAAGSCGDFQRRFIWRTGKERYCTFLPDGNVETLTFQQLNAIKEKSDKRQLSAGGKSCHLLPLKVNRDDVEEKGYWIVAVDSISKAHELAPFLAQAIDSMARSPKSPISLVQLDQYHDFLSKTAAVLSIETPTTIADRLAHLFSSFPVFHAIIVGTGADRTYILSAADTSGAATTKTIPKDLILFERNSEGTLSLSRQDIMEIAGRFNIPSSCFFTFSGFCAENGRPVFFILATLEQIGVTTIGILSHLAEYYSILGKAKEQTQEAFRKAEDIGTAFNLLALQTSKQQLILDYLETGTILVKYDGELIFLNKAARSQLGITKVETTEKVILRSKEPGITLFALIEKVREEKKPARAPVLIDDATIDILVAEIEPDLYFITSSDFTQMKKEIDNRKSLFSLVTHEVKNPLTAILNTADLLRSERSGNFANKHQERLANILYKSSLSMKQILDDVSSYGKAILGTGSDSWIPLKEYIENTVREKEDLAGAKNISVRLDLQECHVLGPAGMVETLLANIIGNAIKYGIVGGNIGIILEEQSDTIALEVIDDGIGIPREDLKRIGEPFFRARNTRDTIAGTGFGLVIVKNIVERLRGTVQIISPIEEKDRFLIGCRSERQRGTKIAIRFPLIRR
jgi:signal transduction histidine kinase